MRIAQVSPLYESVPPRRYGGTERIVHFLTEELVRRGHEVVLYATGDSATSAELRAVCPQALRLCRGIQDGSAYHVLQLGMVCSDSEEFDVVHAHVDFRALLLTRFTRTPIVSTNHNRLDSPEYRAMVRAYPEAWLTSVSDSQRKPLSWANWAATVYNAVPVDEIQFSERPGAYLAFLGRMSPEKGPAEAIEVAKLTGMPLKIAAKINDFEQDYFDAVVRPLLNHPLIEFLGEVGEQEKRELLAGAYALLFPVSWPEPFGLAMIEAMACGTPVLAFSHGAVPEVMEDEVTGFICSDVREMAARVRDVEEIDRRACRLLVERRFSVERMADGYEEAYQRVLASADEPQLRAA
jgi:glycosyltransferase involved in cell wall biosynthesis